MYCNIYLNVYTAIVGNIKGYMMITKEKDIRFRLTKKLWQQLRKAARQLGMSEYIRQAVVEKMEREK